MVQTLFDADQPLAKQTTVTYNLQPSQQLGNIQSVLASRKRRSNVLLSSSSSPVCIPADSKNDVCKKQRHVYDDVYNGLPSPPVERSLDEFPAMSLSKSNHSPPLTPNTAFSRCSSVTTETNSNKNNGPLPEEKEDGLLSTKDIKSKLAALREEKHNMFQLLKRLVEQDEQQQQQQQQQQQAEKEEQPRQESELQAGGQQQQNLRKKKTSRWSSPAVSPSTYQRSSPLSRHQVNSNFTTSRHTAASVSASSFHTHAGSHMYLGGQQSTLHRPHHPPYLY